MKKHKFNLAQQVPDGPALDPATPSSKPDPSYPTLHIDDHPDSAIMGIPDSGESVIKHKVIHRGENIGKDGKKKHSITLEIHSIEPAGGASKKKHTALPGAKEDMDAVDAGMP